MPAQSIAVRSHWHTKSMQAEVTVTLVTIREVSYFALETFSDTLPSWQFLQDFQPVTERKKEGAEQSSSTINSHARIVVTRGVLARSLLPSRSNPRVLPCHLHVLVASAEAAVRASAVRHLDGLVLGIRKGKACSYT